MAEHNDKGLQGEQLARRYLHEQGYEILEANWRLGHQEVDIIARQDGYIVFIEVKTRTSSTFGEPEEAVDRKKQRSYVRLADHYVRSTNRKEEVRFDIIAVILDPQTPTIRHITNAFTVMDALYR